MKPDQVVKLLAAESTRLQGRVWLVDHEFELLALWQKAAHYRERIHTLAPGIEIKVHNPHALQPIRLAGLDLDAALATLEVAQ